MEHLKNISSREFEQLSAALADHYERHCKNEASGDVVVLVLGAGASAASQVPMWDLAFKRIFIKRVEALFGKGVFLQDAWAQLSDEIKQSGNPKDLRTAKPEDLRASREELAQKAKLEQICSVACRYPAADVLIRDLFVDFYTAQGAWSAPDGPGPPPLLTYELIAHLVKHRFVDHVVTFNFDELLDTALENELGTRGFRRVVSGYEPLGIHDKKLPTLIKVHGTVSSPETMRFTYLDVSVMTRSIMLHLEALLGLGDQPPSRRLRLISLGYSWRDRSFARWIEANAGWLKDLTLIRKTSRCNEDGHRLTPELLIRLKRQARKRIKVISTDDLGKTSVEMFCWALIDDVLKRVRSKRLPDQPVSRHLLVSNLCSDRGRSSRRKGSNREKELLRKRAQVEVLLHLAKAKGMVNTASAPTLPRMRAYLDRLQRSSNPSAADFLRDLELSTVIIRSADAEAWDTYFASASNMRDFERKIEKVLSRVVKTPRVEKPEYEGDRIVTKRLQMRSFIREQLKEILDSSEIEVLSGADYQARWSFVKPLPLDTFGRFGCEVAKLVESDWKYLLIITESLRWLNYEWLREPMRYRSGPRTILALLPSEAGLDAWSLRDDFLGGECDLPGVDCDIGRIPWWRHNHHLILAINPVGLERLRLEGVYFNRPFRSSAISPVALQHTRDCVKLLGIFLRYCRRIEGVVGKPRPAVVDSALRLTEELLLKPPRDFDAELQEYLESLMSKL